jgi:hypothetical protein
MVKAMALRDVESALRDQDCEVLSNKGPHTKWGCPCGSHTVPIPRHSIVSPGVVRDIRRRLPCLPEGWLQ